MKHSPYVAQMEACAGDTADLFQLLKEAELILSRSPTTENLQKLSNLRDEIERNTGVRLSGTLR